MQFDIHTYVIACFSILLGVQAISFAAIVRRFATSQQIIPPSPRYSKLLDAISLEHILIVATISMVAGAGGLLWSVLKWNATGFGALDYSTILRTLVLSVAMIATGIQMAFSAFLASIMEIPTQ